MWICIRIFCEGIHVVREVAPNGRQVAQAVFFIEIKNVRLLGAAKQSARIQIHIVVASGAKNYVFGNFGNDFAAKYQHIIPHHHFLAKTIQHRIGALDMRKEKMPDAAVRLHVRLAKTARADRIILVESRMKIFGILEKCGNLGKIRIEKFL